MESRLSVFIGYVLSTFYLLIFFVLKFGFTRESMMKRRVIKFSMLTEFGGTFPSLSMQFDI